MLRLLLPVTAGFLLEYYCHFPLAGTRILIIALIIFFVLFYFLPLIVRFRLAIFHNYSLHLILFFSGIVLIRNKNLENLSNHFSKIAARGDYLLVRITEPPVEKERSILTTGKVKGVIRGSSIEIGRAHV